MVKTSEHYNLPKISYGGSLLQTEAKRIAERLRADVRMCKSIYVGHWCLYITATQSIHSKLRRAFKVS